MLVEGASLRSKKRPAMLQGLCLNLLCLRSLAALQAGTLSGNPLAMVAGIKTLEILGRDGAYEHLDKITKRWVLTAGL